MASLVSAPAAISSGWNLSSIRNALPSIGSRQVRFNYQFSPKSNFGLRLNPGRMEAPKCFTSSFGGLDPLISSFSGQFAPMRIVRRLKIYAMKHGRKVAKLNRPPDQRKALVRGLVTQLLRHGRIKTTFARAKAIRKFTDRMITLAKDGSQHKRRQACGFVYDKLLVHAMFMEAPKRYADRNGGYTSVCRTDNRRGDNAPMAYISLV